MLFKNVFVKRAANVGKYRTKTVIFTDIWCVRQNISCPIVPWTVREVYVLRSARFVSLLYDLNLIIYSFHSDKFRLLSISLKMLSWKGRQMSVNITRTVVFTDICRFFHDKILWEMYTKWMVRKHSLSRFLTKPNEPTIMTQYLSF